MTRPGPDLAALGRELGRRGLHPRGLALWSGTATLARLPERLLARQQARQHQPPGPSSLAALPLELFVAGERLPRAEAARALGESLATCLATGLLVEDGGLVWAPQAVLPLGQGALAVCDPLHRRPHRDATPWPDDSSHHLCGALAGVRAARWLDLGTGSAIAPLGCPQVAPLILGTDVVPGTARAAALGAALSGRRVHVAVSDLDLAVAGAWDLITCNAPIPDEPAAPLAADPSDRASRWRHAAPDFLDRLCHSVARRLQPGGLAVLHTALAPLLRALTELGGDAVCVAYTPAEVPAFAVTWWQPHLPRRLQVVRRQLTPQRPHIDERDRDDADNSRLPPLPELGGS
ncbi:MAG: hypothetical protein IPI49_18490 [Myxococcales bacterium]|nr:hypothetical protein [Myxococcales bacterium]